MSQCLLPHDVYLCFTDDAVVFLDLHRDRYVGLDTAHLPLLRTAIGAADDNSRDVKDLIQSLLANKLLTLDLKLGKSPASVVLPTANSVLVDLDADRRFGSTSPIEAHHIRNFILSYLRATMSFRWGSLERAVRRVRTRKARSTQVSAQLNLDAARDLVRVFQRIRPLVYSVQSKCLLDSLTLVDFLSSYGIFPTWVLGVRTGPFMAHAWVQHDGFVFNDSPARTNSYTPILAI